MKFRLHEVELNSKDPKASRAFYKDMLGLEMNHGEEGLNVFDSGWAGGDSCARRTERRRRRKDPKCGRIRAPGVQ